MSELKRRQRWAAFSVRAHRDLGALASDLLLYDRLVLPVPADEAELDRWEAQDWDPELIALRKVQGGDLIYTVPWTAELRAEHAGQMGLRALSAEIGYGVTANLLTRSEQAWQEIMAGLDGDQVPERKPFLIAAYQSEREAQAALHLRALDHGAPASQPRVPGAGAEDAVVATRVRALLEEPVLADPEEAFSAATELAARPEFEAARRALFSFVDELVIDQAEPSEVEREIGLLEGRYNQAVRDFAKATRKRRAVTLLPRALGAVAGALGVPFGSTVGGALGNVTGRFVPAVAPPDGSPGAAFAMIRAAYRDLSSEPRPSSG